MNPEAYLAKIRSQFPILSQQVNDHPLVYLDNAATTQKPQSVIDAICDYYQQSNANVHRASHTLSNQATLLFEMSREKVQCFINAQRSQEIIWTKGTTEGLNLLANTLAEHVGEGDEILISALEHHANIVPWQMLVQSTGAVLKIIPLNDQGGIDMQAYQQLLSAKTKIVSVAHVSNALGVVNPVQKICELAKQFHAFTIIDGAQAIAHLPVDVQTLDCDFYLFSGHKMYGPTGIGVLYGKYDLLDMLPPWQGGGEMIKSVSFSETIYNQLPFKFEAGTPNIAGVIGLGAAVDFVNGLQRSLLVKGEQQLLIYLEKALANMSLVKVLALGQDKIGAISFVVQGEHCSDIAMLLNAQGIAVRSGSHCAMPLMQEMQLQGTVRVSLALYNTRQEVDVFIKSLENVITMLDD